MWFCLFDNLYNVWFRQLCPLSLFHFLFSSFYLSVSVLFDLSLYLHLSLCLYMCLSLLPFCLAVSLSLTFSDSLCPGLSFSALCLSLSISLRLSLSISLLHPVILSLCLSPSRILWVLLCLSLSLSHAVCLSQDPSVTAVQTAQWSHTAVTHSPAAVSVCPAIRGSIVSSVTAAISETAQVAASHVTVTHPEQRGRSVIGKWHFFPPPPPHRTRFSSSQCQIPSSKSMHLTKQSP